MSSMLHQMNILFTGKYSTFEVEAVYVMFLQELPQPKSNQNSYKHF